VQHRVARNKRDRCTGPPYPPLAGKFRRSGCARVAKAASRAISAQTSPRAATRRSEQVGRRAGRTGSASIKRRSMETADCSLAGTSPLLLHTTFPSGTSTPTSDTHNPSGSTNVRRAGHEQRFSIPPALNALFDALGWSSIASERPNPERSSW